MESENHVKLLTNSRLNRREFLQYSLLAGAGAVISSGCAVNPVTGKNQLMMVSEQTEISIDKQQSPHQFSADYGVVQDVKLNSYITQIGRNLALKTHRPSMPYSFRCVNATYINAYAFPGGSIAVTRGILLELKNEAELAALLGHELGHVNARHSAEQMSKGTLSSILVGGVAAVIGSRNAQMGELAQQIGMVGQGVLLARYSRDNEREADGLGNSYMVDAGYSTDGFVGLMSLLNSMNKGHNASAEILFSTHPMGSERYETAIQNATGKFRNSRNLPLNRERYMDNIAILRSKEDLIKTLQNGDTMMAEGKYDEAIAAFKGAVKKYPDDYTANLMLAKCLLVKKDYKDARLHAGEASKIYPSEAQSLHVMGFASINMKKYDDALSSFSRYEQLLPGSPGTLFFKGYAYEGMKRTEESAGQYKAYLQQVQQGDYAKHAYQRLKEWGYL
ncbi:putative Zn-dependent metalloprotease (TPR repeat protein, peptidase M48 Ste24p [Desulfamplus magnetovallimortis]|uniref:Putative Zn-dependent metalloprotease (TPR repeat protein, peptidase M48 Ste24p) n=1 Tax=Desulfamplus magnetovallimortis TaxID=1246637 RepID=A0A1W1H4V5_9BACT|nr:M48 family metalloprotease [Desulfamplus magnetovallimortis]SLM27398.1 putative Zn-dependent metalloprotease (TPR repeat protein, peptidase M48 Ste24p [Desulfamplus magnetovallimortis]